MTAPLLCELCGSDTDVIWLRDPFTGAQIRPQCDECSERAWQSHQEDYDAQSARERQEEAWHAKRHLG